MAAKHSLVLAEMGARDLALSFGMFWLRMRLYLGQRPDITRVSWSTRTTP